ncbi:MAG: hypothetical protein UT15_C0003G0047 [Berkelbacteria bacterium GW2011_GWA1_39_10]|uniref:SprT-like domain-containing protein n=1 Tax=Berkelbacteria bacterium GW2011_GWA1_39_10 TaxID=1618332 RepID=A0A0G0LIH3_9BACT|nr:MAG: hypothetical protein UT15_C0003G0047 [Berkelbacteria bacterium GW2011_GWA1_39_10]
MIYTIVMQRDHKWLKFRLETIWKRYFPDIVIVNNVLVKFGRASMTRLGSIKYGRQRENRNTIITINGHFKDLEIPEFVIDAVLAHELTHYAHGFFNPNGQIKRFPHKGGVVHKEMTGRGLENLLKLEKKWIKENWRGYIKANHFK